MKLNPKGLVPEPRYKHETIKLNALGLNFYDSHLYLENSSERKMIILGGMNCQTIFGDIFCFNFDTFTWHSEKILKGKELMKG